MFINTPLGGMFLIFDGKDGLNCFIGKGNRTIPLKHCIYQCGEIFER